ncbi:MAG: ABC transporter substrate-binding protein, partial [Vulcanococcus sp.]
QAVALSLDRRLVSQRVSFDMSEPLRSLVPPPLAGSSPPSWPAYDPKAARALYRQEGYCSGQRLTLPLTFRSNHASDRLFALTWQAQLRRDLGDCVRLEITGVESTSAYRQLSQGVFPMIIYDWIGDYPDPDTYLAPLLGCRRSKGDQCLSGSSVDSGSFWTRPGLQQQLQASERRTGAARQSTLLTIQREAADGASFVPLWQVNARAWGQRNLSAPEFDGSGRVILQQLEPVKR